MHNYTVDVPERGERGIRIECTDHGEWEEFQPGYRTVAFYCEGCGLELEVDLRNCYDWRDFGELC